MLQVQKRFWGKRPGFDIGDITHLVVIIGFSLALFMLVRTLNLAFTAVLLVLLSKWRVFAVQPRFWVPNIKANVVDVVVGLSTVILMYQASTNVVAIFWGFLYVLWLLIVKPRTGDAAVAVQAMWAQLTGLIAILMTTSLLENTYIAIPLIIITLWASARHFFANYEEPHYKTLALVWAFLATQIVWFGMHWIQYYRFFGMRISTAALLVCILSLTVGLLYHAFRNDKLQRSIVLENVAFGVALTVLVLLTSAWRSAL